MRVLAVNAGSSSLKLALFDGAAGGEPRRLAAGLVQEIGRPDASARLAVDGEAPVERAGAIADHAGAMALTLTWLRERGLLDGVAAVGHRIVHGGETFTAPVRVDEPVLRELEALRTLAPLHNGPALDALRAARAALGPSVPHVASFDTALHARMPEHAARYAIDVELADRHGIRRYGFHGLAHASMLERYAAHADRAVADLRVVTLQLGNGCSAAALRGGRSIDTTMGLTPLEGLVMGTRSGDVDPALVGFLARREGVDVDEVERWLNHRSGLLGLSGSSSDMRELEAAAAAGDARAELAVDLFCYRVRKAVGAYFATLGGADAVVFGGGIGAGSPAVRARVCEGMEWCGLALDPQRNRDLTGEGPVSTPGSRPEVFVAAVDEELAVARHAATCLGARGASTTAGLP